MKYFLLLLFSGLTTICCWAQKDSVRFKKDSTAYRQTEVSDYVRSDTGNSRAFTPTTRVNSKFIIEYPEELNIGPFLAVPYMILDVDPVIDSLKKFGSQFEGNYSAVLGFNFGYRCIGFSYGFKLPLDPSGISRMGRSSCNVLSTKIYKLPFIISLDYRKYSGFYDINTRTYNPDATDDKPYEIRPDLTFRTYSGNLICNFSWKKYSYSAPINYADRQIRTRAGFLMRGTISYSQLFSDSSFISKQQIGYFPDFYRVKSIDAIVFKAGPGLGLNIVFLKKMYFALTTFLMINNVSYRYTNENNQLTNWKYDVNYFMQLGAGIGYNSERFYAGFRIGGDNNLMSIRGASIQTSFGSASVDIGYRFNTPGFFRKAYDKTLRKYFGL